MQRLGRFTVGGAAAALLCVGGVRAAEQQVPLAGSPPASPAGAIVHTPPEFAGAWDYNPEESINIATGKPEQAPRSATLRTGRPSATVFGGGPRGDGSGGGYDGGYGSRFGPVRGTGIGPSPEMLRQSRDLMRDLLEIPESLMVIVDGDAVTFTDDLGRERSYPTDGRKEHYQLGASKFTARAEWQGAQLRKDIDGDFGFKMSETYFLSPDGKRLFVMLRVPTSGKNAVPIGANRVYDRVPAARVAAATVADASQK
jgi:hypothetical protein